MANIIKQLAQYILKDELIAYETRQTADKSIIDNLSKKIHDLTYSNPKKEYYEKKYPKQFITYSRNERGNNFKIDVRNFIQPYSYDFPKFKGTNDEIAYNALQWIIKNIKYTSDKTQYKMLEYWAFPFETMYHKKGDCEDGAILLASIMIKNGIPNWKIRVSAGMAFDPFHNKLEGHAYCTYYSEENDKWVVLDWCFFPNQLKVKDRKSYKENPYYKDIWFSFNEKEAWGKNEDLRKDDPKKLLNDS